jgi:hypothetical protein
MANVLWHAKPRHQGAAGAPQIVQLDLDAALVLQRLDELEPILEPTAGQARWKQQRAGAARLRCDHLTHHCRQGNVMVGRRLGDGFRQVDALAIDAASLDGAVAGQDVAVALELGQVAAPHAGQQR